MGVMNTERAPWALAGRVAGAGLGGAAVGAAVAGIWHQGAVAATRACVHPDPYQISGQCSWNSDFKAIFCAFVAICLGVLGAFALLRLHRLRVAIPAGCVVVAWAAIGTSTGFPGGNGPAPWAEAIAAGTGLAAVALSASGGRARAAGLALTGVVLLGSLIAPYAIGQREMADARVARFTALGFPLELPAVPGYHVFGADPTADGALVVSMDTIGDDPFGYQFSVTIAPAGNKGSADALATCTHGTGAGAPLPSCQALGPGLWLITTTPFPEVVAEKPGIVAMATLLTDPSASTPASNQLLIQAVSALRPASAAEVAALPALS
jgi:hypothetical protein